MDNGDLFLTGADLFSLPLRDVEPGCPGDLHLSTNLTETGDLKNFHTTIRGANGFKSHHFQDPPLPPMINGPTILGPGDF